MTAIYNIMRGMDKTDQVGIKPIFQTTEFWMGAAAIISNSLLEIKTAGVDSQTLTMAQTIIAVAMAAAQSLAANQPEVKATGVSK